jgi:hypothetical protein
MADAYLQFIWTPNGYQLQEEQGEPPRVGETVDRHGNSRRVLKEAPSPLPNDQRTCAYLQG